LAKIGSRQDQPCLLSSFEEIGWRPDKNLLGSSFLRLAHRTLLTLQTGYFGGCFLLLLAFEHFDRPLGTFLLWHLSFSYLLLCKRSLFVPLVLPVLA
jgi:hypothetical protein